MVLPEVTQAGAEELVPGGDLELRSFTGADLSGRDVRHGRLLECSLTDCRADDLALSGTRVLDCSFDTVSGTAISATRSTWRDVSLVGCRIGVLDAPSSAWTDVSVRSGKVDFLNVRDASLTRVHFEDCWLGEVRLGGASAEQVTFADCRIDSLELRGASVTELDLRGVRLGEHDGVEHLRGARINAAQLIELAPALAEHVGLLVGDAARRSRGKSRARGGRP